jgi:hypothetical protein
MKEETCWKSICFSEQQTAKGGTRAGGGAFVTSLSCGNIKRNCLKVLIILNYTRRIGKRNERRVPLSQWDARSSLLSYWHRSSFFAAKIKAILRQRSVPCIRNWLLFPRNLSSYCAYVLYGKDFSPMNVKYIQVYIYIYIYTNSVAPSPQANYIDWTTATCRRNLVTAFEDRGVSYCQRGGSPTVLNLSFLDWSRYFSF